MMRYRIVVTAADGALVTTPAMFTATDDAAWHITAVLDAARARQELPYAGLRTPQGQRASTVALDADGEAWVEAV